MTLRIRVVFAVLPLALACGGLTTEDAARAKDRCRGTAVCAEGCEDLSPFFGPRPNAILLPPPFSETCFVDCEADAGTCPVGTSCETLIVGCAPDSIVCELGIPLLHVCAGPNDLDWSRRYVTRDAGRAD